jgi:ornithine cyclodeaminase
MPAMAGDAAGVKLVTIPTRAPGRTLIGGLYVLFDRGLRPRALIDAAALTSLRTAAVSALATDLLARADACRLVLFGAGVQAAAHVDGMLAVRPVREVTVVGRGGERQRRLVDDLRHRGVAADVGTPSAVAESDLICTCTTSREPVFDGRLLAAGSHVNAVGSYTPEARELDDATVQRCRLVVEDREAVLAEAGDLIIPIRDGLFSDDRICADLGELVRGATARRSHEEITVFKSVGLAMEDLAVANALAPRALS